MKIVSVKQILILVTLLVVVAVAGLLLIAKDISQLGCRRALSVAATSTQAACSEISKKYLAAESSGAFSADRRVPFQSAILEIVLDHYEGVEGGFWNSSSLFSAYAYPTYEGGGKKTDVPPAEIPNIKKVIAQSLYENRLVSDRNRGTREAVITTACPISKSEALWTMQRVPLKTSATLETVQSKIWILFSVLAALVIALMIDVGRKIRGLSSELTEAGTTITEQRERLTRSDRLRAVGEMASGVAHDLREPLGTLRLKLENLAAAPEKRAKEAVPVALAQIDRLDRFVEMILALTRPFQIKPETVDILSWFHDGFLTAKNQATAKEVQLYFDSDVENWNFDPFQLARALSNVIENAIAFTPKDGSVVVRAYLESEDLLYIDVRDSGPGLSEQLKKSVFKDSKSERVGGSGLGLLLAKEIVEAHRGKIDVLDGGAQGAWFRLEIPK